jgi:hypothetical protein
MKFLLLVKEKLERPHQAEPGKLNRVVRDHLRRLLDDRTLDCVYYMLPHGGAAIVNAGSHEELLRVLRAWPGASQHAFEIHLLSDIFEAVDDNFTSPPDPGHPGPPAK